MPKVALPHAMTLASRGLVTRERLVAGGVDAALGDRLVRELVWRRLAPSVYLTGAGPPTDTQLVRAARRHVGEDLVVTGLVACRALGMADVPDSRAVEVLIGPGTRSVSSAYVLVHQTRRMPATWICGGVRYAMPDRAVVDAARQLTELRAIRALVLGAVCRGVCAAADLRAEVEAGHRRGSGLVRRAVDDAVAGAWSAPEAEVAELLAPAVVAGRVPPFLLNPRLVRQGDVLGRPDGYIPGTGVGWQVDSRRHHSSDDTFDDTLAVHDGYAAHDLTLLHVTPRLLRGLGPAWVDLLAAAVRARRTAGHGEPAGLVIRPTGPLQTGHRRRPQDPAC